ncbi:hypothetical protein G7B13_29860, partial [Klebsiella pneumoniae]|nr:hypothetical protein [Klebsiella pneumoniae]
PGGDDIPDVGDDYTLQAPETVRGRVAFGALPWLRQQLLPGGDDIPDVGDDYTLQAPETVRGRVAFGALPWL